MSDDDRVSPEELERRARAKQLELLGRAKYPMPESRYPNPARQEKRKAMREEGLSARQYRKRQKAKRRAERKEARDGD